MRSGATSYRTVPRVAATDRDPRLPRGRRAYDQRRLRAEQGYVPNVAYSCGAMIHNAQLYLPFATSDMITRIAMVSLESLLERLVK
jgi:hypothetical protein